MDASWRALRIGSCVCSCVSVGCGPDADVRITDESSFVSAKIPTCSLEGLSLVSGDEPTSATNFGAGTSMADEGHADPRPFFSFFVTSQAGLFGLSATEHAPAPDPVDGYGGNLGGLRGADEICTALARHSNPGDRKTWRAFLSASGEGGTERVNAIERVGQGPWFDFRGFEIAADLEGLLPDASGRPRGADPRLSRMFSDENGEDARRPGQDNHDTLTGSDACGRLYAEGAAGSIATCDDWTSNSLHGIQGDLAGRGGQVPVGHSWPRAFGAPGGDEALGARWISDHTINGCEPGAQVLAGAGAPPGDFRVGAGGGYGGIYCFALGAQPPGL